jgi:ribulose 1,5-bisphosphate synthetase/thiazole synthase
MLKRILNTNFHNLKLNNNSKYFVSYDYDVAIVGGGPAGYVAAIKAG